MIEFFTDLMIVTGGVLCLLFWFVVIIAGLIELIDTLNKPKVDKTATTIDEEHYS